MYGRLNNGSMDGFESNNWHENDKYYYDDNYKFINYEFEEILDYSEALSNESYFKEAKWDEVWYKWFKDAGYIYESLNQDQNFTGENSDSCGYFCIFYLLNFVRKFRRAGYQYVVFETNKQRFIDTIPAEKHINVNIEKMEEEITNNLSVDTSHKNKNDETSQDETKE